jgi:hypothetical protein
MLAKRSVIHTHCLSSPVLSLIKTENKTENGNKNPNVIGRRKGQSGGDLGVIEKSKAGKRKGENLVAMVIVPKFWMIDLAIPFLYRF